MQEKMMRGNIVWKVLGFLWCFPVTFLGWVLFFGPQYYKGTFGSVRITEDLAIIWAVDPKSSFFKEAMRNWYGFVVGANVCVINLVPGTYSQWCKHLKHEIDGHVFQNYLWGIFFYPAYILCTVFIYLFLHSKHAYLSNPFERNARRRAGQVVDIPPEDWPDGKLDRWPWW